MSTSSSNDKLAFDVGLNETAQGKYCLFIKIYQTVNFSLSKPCLIITENLYGFINTVTISDYRNVCSYFNCLPKDQLPFLIIEMFLF